jgi:Conserved oligomeric complex COG6
MNVYAGISITIYFTFKLVNVDCMSTPSTITNMSYIRWVQAECKKLGDTDNPEVGELLKMAIRCLKERPVLFKYCAEEVQTTKQ